VRCAGRCAGDNAYNDATFAEFKSTLFTPYQNIVSKVPAYLTYGNHDGGKTIVTASSATQTGPYFDLFMFPKQGEAGGVPSGTEAYNSFYHGPIHVVVLNSFDMSR
jgi:hypothetical protein